MNRMVARCACAVLSGVMVGCAPELDDAENRIFELPAAAPGPKQGFFSPIALPGLAAIPQNACVEPVITQGNDNTWVVNGETLVDLGIFHIHTAIEHTGLGDACNGNDRCGAAAAREAHIPLGTAACRAGVLAKQFPDSADGRKARADELLGCAKAVVGYAVCLDGAALGADLGLLWNQMQGVRCYNFGGPTGSHADHPGMVQWIHIRDYCGSLSSDADSQTTSYEPGKLHVSITAPCVESGEGGGDVPICGAVNPNGCDECGLEHQRCCDPNSESDCAYYCDYPDGDGCIPGMGLHCVAGRCHPFPPLIPECGPALQGNNYCKNGHVYYCDDGGLEHFWTDCAHRGCNEETGACYPPGSCGPALQGNTYCLNGHIHYCDDGGLEHFWQNCAHRGCNEETGECYPPGSCGPALQGNTYCLNGHVYYCDDGGLEHFWADCGNRGCNEAAGECNPPQCASALQGSQYCKDGQLYSCDVEGMEHPEAVPCAIEIVPCMGALPGDPNCTLAVSAVFPTVLEPRARVPVSIAGTGFTPDTSVVVQGGFLLSAPAITAGLIAVDIEGPWAPGTYSITVSQPVAGGGPPATSSVAITVSATACSGLECGACSTQAECVDGDGCTNDSCAEGTCIHAPSPACCPGGTCDICARGGDVNGSGNTNVADVLCGLLVNLWMQIGKSTAIPACINQPVQLVDTDCNGSVNVADVVLLVYRALQFELPQSIDLNLDSCHDACCAP